MISGLQTAIQKIRVNKVKLVDIEWLLRYCYQLGVGTMADDTQIR